MQIRILAAILLACCSGHAVLAQLDTSFCEETTKTDSMPVMMQRYRANMITASIQDDLRLGHVSILVDSNSSRSAVTVELTNKDEFRAVFDSATNQILVINHNAEPYDVDNCQVQNTTAGSYPLMATIRFLGKDRIIPTGNFFSSGGFKIEKKPDENINGVIATPYYSCHYAESLQATMEMTWWYDKTSGPQTPMQVRSRYRFKSSPSQDVEVTYLISPLLSFPEQHDAAKHPFTAPRGVYCKGLISAKQAPNTYNRFSLGFDRFIYNLQGFPVPGPDSFRESYDLRGNSTLMEGEGLSFSLDKNKYGGGILARINDFTRGISYVKNLRFGNCSYERIPVGDWDSNPSPNGLKIKTPEEFFTPGLNLLQYKGTGIYRTTEVDTYIGYMDDYIVIDGKKYPFTIEYYMDIKTSYDGTGNPVYKSVPLATYAASPAKFYSVAEIFDFNSGVPRTYDHDISDCFSATQKMHFELILATDDLDDGYVKYLSDYRDEFLYALTMSLSKAINISPLRIIQPEVSLFAAPLILVEITISDRVTVPGYTPDMPEIQLSQVTAAMSDLAAKGSLFVDVMEGDLVFQVPIKDFVGMDARGSPSAPATGMSSGAVAGLCIGMILLGIVIGVAAIFAVGYFRKDSVFGFKPFGGQQEA